MPRTAALAAYVLVCVMGLAGGFVAGAIHAASNAGDPPPAVWWSLPDDRKSGRDALAAPMDAPATPSMP